MASFYGQYGTVAVLVAGGAAIYAVILLLNRVLSPDLPSPDKLSTFECGVDAVGEGWSQMNIRYYVFAFLFVIFDVESVFLFPWAVILGELEGTGLSPVFVLVEMFIFVAILLLGLVYAWRKKVLVWE